MTNTDLLILIKNAQRPKRPPKTWTAAEFLPVASQAEAELIAAAVNEMLERGRELEAGR